jgi:hypothetical protein
MADDDEPAWLTEVYAVFKGARKRDYLVLDEGAPQTLKQRHTADRVTPHPPVLQIQPSRENRLSSATWAFCLCSTSSAAGASTAQSSLSFRK